MKKFILPLCFIFIGTVVFLAGVYLGDLDDSPGLGGLGVALMCIFYYIAWRFFKRQ